MEILRAISSSSQSVTVLPSETFPNRVVIPAVCSNDDTSCVFPVAPWPTMPTFLIDCVLYVRMDPPFFPRRVPACARRAANAARGPDLADASTMAHGRQSGDYGISGAAQAVRAV